jgi:hypothetical protein
MFRIGSTRRAAAAALAAALALAGCQKSDSVSHYDRFQQAQRDEEQARQDTAGWLKGQGAKLEKKRYPQGEAWAIDLRGVNVTDDLLAQIGKLLYVSELNLNKTNVTDAHLAKMNELQILKYCVKLDLSQTAVTDAGLDSLTNTLGPLGDLYLTGTKVTPAAVDRLIKRRQDDPHVPKMFKNSTKAHF